LLQKWIFIVVLRHMQEETTTFLKLLNIIKFLLPKAYFYSKFTSNYFNHQFGNIWLKYIAEVICYTMVQGYKEIL
jgi:hypothetical protein